MFLWYTAKELDQIELGGSHLGCGDDRFELFDWVNAGEKTDQVDGSYGAEESAEADAGTEKLLGNHEL